jgi:nitrate reductase NapA
MGNTDIGYGFRPEHVMETRAAHSQDPGVSRPGSFEEYAELLKPYTVEHAAEVSGVRRSGWRLWPGSTLIRR